MLTSLALPRTTAPTPFDTPSFHPPTPLSVLWCLQQVARLLLKWLAAFCMLDCVSTEKQVGTLLLYDTLMPRSPGITDPMAVAEYAAGGVAFGNAVWAYGALMMLDPKASTHVQWPESNKAQAWHEARRTSNSHLYPPSDVLFAAMGPFILDSSNENWIFTLAEHLRGAGGAAALAPSRTTPPPVLRRIRPWASLRAVQLIQATRIYCGLLRAVRTRVTQGTACPRGPTHGLRRIYQPQDHVEMYRGTTQAGAHSCTRARRQQR